VNLSDSSDGSDSIGKVVDVQDWQSEAPVSVLCKGHYHNHGSYQ